jgi:RecA-family ATPase
LAELLSDFLKKERLAQPYIIGRGVLPVGGKMIIAGSPKANKSFVALNLMLDLVRGRPIFGAEYRTGKPVFPVEKPWRGLYLEQELGDQGLLERLQGKDGRAGLCTGIIPEGLKLFIHTRDTDMRLDKPEGREYIREIIKECLPLDFMIFDPMAKFHLADENSAQEMGAFMRVLDHIIEDFHVACIVVHHIGKQYEENPRRGGDRLRGSSAVFGDIDTLLECTRKSTEHTAEPVLELSFELRRGEPIETIYVQRRRDGTIEWLGDDYTFGGEKDSEFRGKYREL